MSAEKIAPARVPVPEPGLTARELIGRAQALRPHLRESQADTEQRGAPAKELHRLFDGNGFYRTLQPRRFGGYEFDIPTFFEIVIQLACGCPSAGWYCTLLSGHPWLLASFFDEEIQATCFKDGGDFRAPSRAQPLGTATHVEDGWIVDGVWDYCSGAPYSNWFMPVVRIAGEQEETKMGLAVIPSSEWEMLDDWRGVLGVRGSGSNSIRIGKAHVPEGYVIHHDLANPDVSGGTIGSRLHGNPMYGGRQLGFFVVELAAIAVGILRASLDEYELLMREKKTNFPPFTPRYQNHDYQRIYGLAAGMTDSAESVVLHAGQRIEEHCRENVAGLDPFTALKDQRIAAEGQQACDLCWQAMGLLFRTAGSSPMKDGQRMQRYFRDLSMIRGHFSQQFDTMSQHLSQQYFQADA